MEIQEKYLSPNNCEDGDIITFIDAGEYAEIKDQSGKSRRVINFKVNNGRYELIYTPASAAQKVLMKAFSRETNNWVGKKFTVKIVDTMSFGKPSKMILPQPIQL